MPKHVFPSDDERIVVRLRERQKSNDNVISLLMHVCLFTNGKYGESSYILSTPTSVDNLNVFHCSGSTL